jgi:beta-glucosidase
MINAIHRFPDSFLWGTATSSHQVEGENRNNDWWDWENQPGRITHDHTSGKACDWWGGRWEEDFDRASSAGQNAHRMSIEWSRIEPKPGEWDEDALGYYRQILQGALDRGLKPVVTLHHFSNPMWLADQDGWMNPEVVTYFERYVRKAVHSLKDLVKIWVTINEPNVYAVFGYLDGLFPPGIKELGATFQVVCHLVLAHAAAYHAIHEIDPGASVGISHYYRGMQPANSVNPLDRWVTRIRHQNFNEIFPRAVHEGVIRFLGRKIKVPQAIKSQDYFGLDYYTSELVSFNLFQPKMLFSKGFFPDDAVLSGTGFIMDFPEGLWEALNYAHSFNLPIYVMENGVEDAGDRMRSQYLAHHIRQVWRAVNFNWYVLGYFYWTLVDNFEWERGWTQRFGLWGLDVETQVRQKRPSADFYAEICRSKGLSSEMVAKYASEILDEMFPGKGPGELSPKRRDKSKRL